MKITSISFPCGKLERITKILPSSLRRTFQNDSQFKIHSVDTVKSIFTVKMTHNLRYIV